MLHIESFFCMLMLLYAQNQQVYKYLPSFNMPSDPSYIELSNLFMCKCFCLWSYIFILHIHCYVISNTIYVLIFLSLFSKCLCQLYNQLQNVE